MKDFICFVPYDILSVSFYAIFFIIGWNEIAHLPELPSSRVTHVIGGIVNIFINDFEYELI